MRFHFHQADGVRHPDDEGTELPDLDAARREALLVMADAARGNIGEFWKEGFWRVSVTDESGALMFALELTAVEGRNGGGAKS